MSTEPPSLPDDGKIDAVERALRAAAARGEFDNLPGSGKPIADLDREYDPDWWARRFLERAQIEDAADEVRRLIRKELPALRTMPDRTAAASRIGQLNSLIDGVNRKLSEGDRIPTIAL